MRSYFVVFWFEFVQQLKKKAIIISTIVSSLIIAVLLVAPTVINSQNAFEQPQTALSHNLSTEIENSGYVVNDQSLRELVEIDQTTLYSDEATLVQAISDKKLKVGFVLNSINDVKAIYGDKLTDDNQAVTLQTILKDVYLKQQLKQKGLTIQEYQALSDFRIQMTQQVLGKDAIRSLLINFVFIFAVYILVLMYGQSVATSIAREKDSKAMELLITVTKPKTLIIGKVLAGGLVAICQLFVLFIVSLITYNLVKDQYPLFVRMFIDNAMTLDSLLVYIVFGLVGFLLYLFIFASLGSLVNRMEDVTGVITPIILLFMIGYFIALFAVNAPTHSLVQIVSWIPFFSLLIVPIRYTLTNISLFELLGQLSVMFITIGVFAYLSIKIYEWGSLNYGNKVSIIKAIKGIFSSR